MTDASKTQAKKLTFKDFKSDQQVRWCPGCGDIAILNSVQKAMAQMDIKKEDYAVISGIGCSSRFPYYMNTYGFHGIHGRAGVLASGVKTANPNLSVWQITGDGDGLAIGGNHFIHEIRRNIDLNILLFNNEIYGLTKGQFSPTSEFGTKTKTSPFGTTEVPFQPGELVLGARGNFFARTTDVNIKETTQMFIDAENHNGTSVIEILQNCVIFKHGTHFDVTAKDKRDNAQIWLQHGEKMLFGKDKERGIILEGMTLRAVTIGEDGITIDDILTHDAHVENNLLHIALVNMKLPELPVAMGIIRAVKGPVYNDLVDEQIEHAKSISKIKCVDDLLRSGSTWTV